MAWCWSRLRWSLENGRLPLSFRVPDLLGTDSSAGSEFRESSVHPGRRSARRGQHTTAPPLSQQPAILRLLPSGVLSAVGLRHGPPAMVRAHRVGKIEFLLTPLSGM